MKQEQESKPKKMCTSKKIAYFFCFMYLEVVIYGQAAMWHFENIDSLANMWEFIVPPIVAVLAYFAKSAVENRKGGIVYEKALEKAPEMTTEDEEADG